MREIPSPPDSQEWLRENAGRLDNNYMITTRLMRRIPVPARFIRG